MRIYGKHLRTEGGFTLIELLVVIAIIALLMSILMPALGQAREQARRVVCLTNLKSLGTAINNYASEFREVIVPGSYLYGRDDEPGPKFRQDWAAFLAINGYITAPIYESQNAPHTGQQVPQGALRSILLCPNSPNIVRENWGVDPFLAVGPSDQPADLPNEERYIYFSYGSNGSNNIATDQLPMRMHATRKSSPHTFPKASKPASTVLLYDGSWSHNGLAPERINAHHINGTETAVLMMDSHAESFARENLPMPELGDFGDLDYLKDNYPYPLWRFDQ